MKKIFSFFAMALFAMTAFAQTNLWSAAPTVHSTWGQNDPNPEVTIVNGNDIHVVLDGAPADELWSGQVKITHDVNFEADKFYAISMDFLSTSTFGQAKIKMDDNNGMLLHEDLAFTANEVMHFTDTVAGVAGNNHVLVFAFAKAAAGTTIDITNITIHESNAPVPPAFDGCGDTFVSTSGNAAAGHDGNTGSRWESASKDPQYWQWNMAEAQTFNRIKIVWEGAYGKTFNIKAGMSCDNLTTIASVENQTLAGFPYTQIIELAESVTASSIQFEGIARGTNYGYSFWEFDVYTAQTAVLSDLDFTAAAVVSAIGGTVNLTATPKDQYNLAMEAEVTYTVTPAAAGHVTNGVYTADAAGLATITATAGEFSKTVTVFNYEGENVALNKSVTGEGFNDAARVNDGNEGTEYQADPNNGGAGVDVDAEFVIDLGAAYDLNLVTIKFEGACSQIYTLETSADNVTYNVAYSYSGNEGINGHTDFLYGENLANAAGVRYIKFHSTKNATGWGCKIFELKAYGVEHVGTSLENVDTVETVKFIQNGQLFIMKNAVLYNALGVRL